MKDLGVFSPKTLAAWLAVAFVLFAGAVYFGVFGADNSNADTTGPSSFSRSAIGYAGFADIIRRLGVRVVKSRYASLSKVSPDGVLIVAEPPPSLGSPQWRSLITARRVLLVLPKWSGKPSESKPGWIEDAVTRPETTAQAVLQTAVANATIVRSSPTARWSRNEIGGTPTVVDPLQLVKSDRLLPLVGNADGILLGELRTNNRRLWILADPDVMENHGLSEPANAEFSAQLINALRGSDGNVVFDETVHGYLDTPNNPWRLPFQFPFVLATIQGALAVALLLWATMGRFGAPLSPPSALQSGKQGLIANTAKLFEFAGYQSVMVQRYVHSIIRDVGRQLHAPPGMSEAAMVEWLGRVGRARAVDVECGAVMHRVDELVQGRSRDPRPLAALAREIYRWKREIIDGVARGSRPHRGDS
ncbi:MAG: DUF4350 domain-containing protein [Xanthobacteraceae bacterium]